MTSQEAIDDEEEEVFQIDDFTAASEWERFIYQIEEVIGPLGWKLDNTQRKETVQVDRQHKASTGNTSLSKESQDSKSLPCRLHMLEDSAVGEWTVRTEGLKFADFPFVLSHHKLDFHGGSQLPNTVLADGLPQALVDTFDLGYDFPPRSHCLGRWYGIKEFIVLSPANKDDMIETESRINLLWSSLGIAVSNLNCHVPVFVQVGARNRLLYYGMCVGGGFRTSFEMIHLRSTPHECSHVHGMMETFRSKLACPMVGAASVSVRFTYVIKDWPEDLWFQLMPDVESEFGIEVGINTLEKLPFGPLQDPIKDMQLSVTWPCLSADVVVDDGQFSDLEPLQAPRWSLKVRVVDSCTALLSEHLDAYMKLCNQLTESTARIIRSLSTDSCEPDQAGLTGDVASVLDRIAKPLPSLGTPLTSVASVSSRKVMKTRLNESPIPEILLNKVLEFLFPDAWLSVEEAWIKQGQLDDLQKVQESEAFRIKNKFRHLKSAPVDSLTYCLALCLCILNYSYGGVQAVAHLWHEFVLEMRYRLENSILIPRLAQTPPNLNYCLIHQKLQMLNCCILRRQCRNRSVDSLEQVKLGKESSSVGSGVLSVSYKDYIGQAQEGAEVEREVDLKKLKRDSVEDSWQSDDSDDEFLDAVEEQRSSSLSPKLVEASDSCAYNKPLSRESADESLPCGSTEALREGVMSLTTLTLLATGEPLCIPITQEHPPLTEDTLLEQQSVLVELGTSEEAARVRAQMQSASLLSDMEAFKAANPGCVLADFVRWYSPNDWLKGPETELEREEYVNYVKDKTQKGQDAQPSKQTDGWDFDSDDMDSHLSEISCCNVEHGGHLSLRMRLPGNIWQETWAAARPVAVKRQKRLFDDTKEAEKVLHYLANLPPNEIALQLFPVVVQASIVRLDMEEGGARSPQFMDNIIKTTSRIHSPSKEDAAAIQDIILQVRHLEAAIVRTQSLRMKFRIDQNSESVTESLEDFISELLEKKEVPVVGGARSDVGRVIVDLLQHQKEEEDADAMLPPQEKADRGGATARTLPQPTGREYILRATACRPSPNSRPSPQRLFAVITPDDFRMAGCFTQDSNFL